MNSFSFSYSVTQSLKGLWRNRVMSIASILVLVSCMLVLGTFYALNLNINYNLDDLTLLNEVAAFVDEDCTNEEIEEVRGQIVAMDDLVNDVEYISKEMALEAEKEKFKDYPALFASLQEGANPYRASFMITYKDASMIEDLEYKLGQISIVRIVTAEDGTTSEVTVYPVNKVTSHTDLADTLESLRDGVRNVLVGFMAILFVVSMFIIVNTIRIAVFTRQKEISVMRYVGATKGYIVVPFVFEGIFMGLIASILAFLAEWLLYGRAAAIITEQYRIFTMVDFGGFALMLGLSFLVIGLFAGVSGSMISVASYLKEKE